MPAAVVLILALVPGPRSSVESVAHSFEPLPIDGCVDRVALDPSDPDVLFGYSDDPPELQRSDDGGLGWTGLTVPGAKLVSVVVSPASSSRVYAVSNGFYVSDDGGRHWARSPAAPTDLSGELVLDPFDPQRLYVASNSIHDETVFGAIWFSPDEGAHWLRRDAGIPVDTPPSGLSSIVADPLHPGVLLVTHPTGLYRTSDGGETWTFLSAGATAKSFEPGSSDVVWGAASGHSPVVSFDGGSTWHPRPIECCPDPNPNVILLLWDLVPDPVLPGVAYAVFAKSMPFLYRDDVLRWTNYSGWTSMRGGKTYPSGGFKKIALDGAGRTMWVSAGCAGPSGLYQRPLRRTIEVPVR
jgi:photosystem II stability/assembly factor-like uncharacterized protein